MCIFFCSSQPFRLYRAIKILQTLTLRMVFVLNQIQEKERSKTKKWSVYFKIIGKKNKKIKEKLNYYTQNQISTKLISFLFFRKKWIVVGTWIFYLIFIRTLNFYIHNIINFIIYQIFIILIDVLNFCFMYLR